MTERDTVIRQRQSGIIETASPLAEDTVRNTAQGSSGRETGSERGRVS